MWVLGRGLTLDMLAVVWCVVSCKTTVPRYGCRGGEAW